MPVFVVVFSVFLPNPACTMGHHLNMVSSLRWAGLGSWGRIPMWPVVAGFVPSAGGLGLGGLGSLFRVPCGFVALWLCGLRSSLL